MKQILLLITFLHLLTFGVATAAPVPLYELSSTPTKAAADIQIVGAVESVDIRLDAGLIDIAPERLTITLLDGRRIDVERSDFAAEPRYLRWVGDTPEIDGGQPGYVHLVDHGEQVSGVVNLGSERYQIVPRSDGGHRLVEVARSGSICALDNLSEPTFEPESEPWDIPGSTDGEVGARDGDGALDEDGAVDARHEKVQITQRLDVLVVYPASVFSSSAVQQLHHFIDMSESMANNLFVRSKVGVRYHVTAIAPLTVTPPNPGLQAPLEDWLNSEPAEVVALRQQYAADMVALVVPFAWGASEEACAIANMPVLDGGIAYFDGQFGDKAFTAHRLGCGLNDFTFGHELGHNLGMRHADGEPRNDPALFAHGLGYEVKYRPWQTLQNGTLEQNVQGEFLVGYHFTPLEDVVLTHLGGFFHGLKTVRVHEKGDPTPLIEKDVPSNQTWRYVDLGIFRRSGLQLKKNVTYTVLVDTDGEGNVFWNTAQFPRTYGPIRIEGTTAISTVLYPGQMPTNTATDRMYGVVDIEVGLSTAMACLYPAPLGPANIADEVCHHIPYLSSNDPTLTYRSERIGDAGHDNARVARQRAPTVAGYETNSAPQCTNDSFTTTVNRPLGIYLGNLLGNDTDPEGDALRLERWDLQTARGGTNNTGHTGGFTYTPPTGFSGLDWFTYTVSDKVFGIGNEDTCTVYVDVVQRTGGGSKDAAP